MDDIPEILYERLADAVDESLSASASIRGAIGKINDAGYQVMLRVCAEVAAAQQGPVPKTSFRDAGEGR